MTVCSVWGITSHALTVQWNRRTFNLEPTRGLSCFQIAHHTFCAGLWIPKVVENLRTLRKGRVVKRQCYRVCLKHLICCQLTASYGFGTKLTLKKSKASMSNQDNSSDDEFGNTVLENENEEEESNEEDTANNDSDNFQDCVE